MNHEQLQQLIAASQAEVDAAMLLLQGAQSRLKGLLALKPDEGAPEAPQEPTEPSRGARLIEQFAGSTFGDDDEDG